MENRALRLKDNHYEDENGAVAHDSSGNVLHAIRSKEAADSGPGPGPGVGPEVPLGIRHSSSLSKALAFSSSSDGNRNVGFGSPGLGGDLVAIEGPGSQHAIMATGRTNSHHGNSPNEWQYFDESGYIKAGALRPGEDPYIRNRFNQAASDALPSNRAIPDTRHMM